MAISYNIVRKSADVSKVVADVTLDGAYAAGGYALSYPSLGMYGVPDMIDPQVISGQGLSPGWNKTTAKLMMFKNAAGAGAFTECVAGDISNAVVVRCEALGAPLF